MDHQVGRRDAVCRAGQATRTAVHHLSLLLLDDVLDVSHKSVFHRHRKDASGPSSSQSAGLQLPQGE